MNDNKERVTPTIVDFRCFPYATRRVYDCENTTRRGVYCEKCGKKALSRDGTFDSFEMEVVGFMILELECCGARASDDCPSALLVCPLKKHKNR